MKTKTLKEKRLESVLLYSVRNPVHDSVVESVYISVGYCDCISDGDPVYWSVLKHVSNPVRHSIKHSVKRNAFTKAKNIVQRSNE